MPTPALTRTSTRGRPRGLVLMLHGGRADGLDAVDERALSWRRSHAMMRHISGRLTTAGVDVWLLRNGVRGWNAGAGAVPSPIPDARWALDEVRRERGAVPVVLLGHSMGGRAAVAVADDPSVVGVVGLAPWLPPGEPTAPLAGKLLAVAHGRRDRITSMQQSRAFCQGAQGIASSVELVDMGRVGHYMLRSMRAWNLFATSRSLDQLGVPAWH